MSVSRRRRRNVGHTSNGRGGLLIERTFPAPIGKLRMSSGTTDPQALRDVNEMLTGLAKSVPPRWDILEAIASKRVKPMHALSLYRQNRLEEIPRADVLPRLVNAVEAWQAGLEVGEAYRAQVASTFRKLLALGPDATIGEVAELLKLRRVEALEAETPVGFNRSKSHVQAFVRDTLGDDHPLYRIVSKVPLLEVAETLKRRALPPDQAAFYLAGLPAPHQWIGWSLCVTGMRPKEYFAPAWALQLDRVSVGKSKTDAGRRDIPLWAPALPVLPTRSRDAFEDMWSRKIGSGWGIYNLRRSFAVWMEDAGIPRSRRKIYLGHATGDVTGMYERRELDDWRKGDAERLEKFAGGVVAMALAAIQPTPLVEVA